MTAVYKRELKSLFNNLTGYVFIAFLFLFAGIYTIALNFGSYGYSNYEYVLSNMSFVFILATPVLTMRVLAEEKKSKTDQLLYSLPIKLHSVVLGKYFSMISVLLATCVALAFMPLVLSFYGTVNFASAYGSLIGFFFMGSAMIAIGMFASSLTESQLISGVICLGSLLILYLMNGIVGLLPTTAVASVICYAAVLIAAALVIYFVTKNYIISAGLILLGGAALITIYLAAPDLLENSFPSLLESLAIFDRFYTFVNGMFDLTALFYYFSICFIFVFLTIQRLEKRRWN